MFSSKFYMEKIRKNYQLPNYFLQCSTLHTIINIIDMKEEEMRPEDRTLWSPTKDGNPVRTLAVNLDPLGSLSKEG